MYTGSCLCGGIQFRIESELAAVQICHCVQCRKAQGGPFSTNIPVARDAFQLTAGEQLLKSYESSPGKYRHFCGTCGSPVFSRRESVPGVLRIRAGLINEPLQSRLDSHAFVASKCNWWPISDELPQYEGGRPA
jgi:hypothetical protein